MFLLCFSILLNVCFSVLFASLQCITVATYSRITIVWKRAVLLYAEVCDARNPVFGVSGQVRHKSIAIINTTKVAFALMLMALVLGNSLYESTFLFNIITLLERYFNPYLLSCM